MSMRTCFFWYRKWPQAEALLDKHAPDAERVWTGPDDNGYWRQFAARWGGDTMLMIEGDIGIHAGVVPEMTQCGEPWCSFPFPAGGLNSRGLGCTKFSAALQQKVTIQDIMCPAAHLDDSSCKGFYCEAGPGHPGGGGCWNRHRGCPDCGSFCYRHLDAPILGALQIAGGLEEPHVHYPPVRHFRYEPEKVTI